MHRSEERQLEFQEEIAYFNANMVVWTDECGSDRGKGFLAIPVLTTSGIEDVFVTDTTVN